MEKTRPMVPKEFHNILGEIRHWRLMLAMVEGVPHAEPVVSFSRGWAIGHVDVVLNRAVQCFGYWSAGLSIGFVVKTVTSLLVLVLRIRNQTDEI